MKIAVAPRKSLRRISIADEYDSEQIADYCREFGPRLGGSFEIVLPEDRAALDDVEGWDGFLFIGGDEFTRRFIEQHAERRPIFLWAKGYDLTLDREWSGPLNSVQIFFNSSYLSGVADRYNDRTHYLPTAFHDRWPQTFSDSINAARNRLVDFARFDLVFSGSDRHVREDRYRQRLLNLLVRRGLKICVAAPRAMWGRPHQSAPDQNTPLDRSVFVLGNWGTERTFRHARCVLDLPWLDNVFQTRPPGHDPDRTVFALGWNVFRCGAYGASVLTYDCAANRDLGLDEENCHFYAADVSDLETLADEIARRVREIGQAPQDDRRARLKKLFNERHTYRARWADLCREMSRALVRQPQVRTA